MDDTLIEGNETFLAVITEATSGGIAIPLSISRSTTNIIILDDEVDGKQAKLFQPSVYELSMPVHALM